MRNLDDWQNNHVKLMKKEYKKERNKRKKKTNAWYNGRKLNAGNKTNEEMSNQQH